MSAVKNPRRMSGKISGLIFVLATAIAVLSANHRCWAAASPDGSIDVNELLGKVREAVSADPALEGAWLDVDRDDAAGRGTGPAGVVFSRVFDVGQEGRQAVAMDRIIRELVPTGQSRVDASRDIALPVSELKSRIKRLIAQDQVRFDGCRLLGVGLRRNRVDGRIVVVPRFRVRRPGQFIALITECNRLLNGDPTWRAAEVSAVDTDTQQVEVIDDLPTPDPNVVLKRMVEALRSDPDLQGAWLTIDTDDQGFPGIAARLIVFRRTLDEAHAAAQSAAIAKLVRSLVPSGRFRIETASDRSLPLSSVVDEMRRIIDLEPAFAGCAIESASYVPASVDAEQRFDILLQGRVWKKSQVGKIAELCGRLLAADPVWTATRAGVSVESAKTLVEVPPDPAMAAVHYSDAMHRFWAGDYVGADRRLAIASLDDPANLVYRYWRVIGGLASGDEIGAEDRLRRTIFGFGVRPHSAEYLAVLRAIYRIQGPIRMALIAAERKVMAEASLDGLSMGTALEL